MAYGQHLNCKILHRVTLLQPWPEVESRTQGSRPRPRTQKKSEAKDSLFEDIHSQGPRTGILEAKDQGHKRNCSPKKRSSQKFFKRSPQKNVFPKNFSSTSQYFNNSKNSAILEPWTGQFSRTWGLEAKAKDFKMCPRGRPPQAKDVLKDSDSGLDQLHKNFSGNHVFPSPKLNKNQKEQKDLRR